MLTRPACGCSLTLAKDAQEQEARVSQRRRRRNPRTDHGYRQDIAAGERIAKPGDGKPKNSQNPTSGCAMSSPLAGTRSIERVPSPTPSQRDKDVEKGEDAAKGSEVLIGPPAAPGAARTGEGLQRQMNSRHSAYCLLLRLSGCAKLTKVPPLCSRHGTLDPVANSASQLAVAHSCRSTCRSVSEALSEQACISVSRMRWRRAAL